MYLASVFIFLAVDQISNQRSYDNSSRFSATTTVDDTKWSKGNRCRPIPAFDFVAKMAKSGPQITATINHSQGSFPILVELVSQSEQQTTILHSVDCGFSRNTQTTISFRTPPDLGKAYLIVYGDIDGKGPSTNDLIGRSEAIIIDQKDVKTTFKITEKGSIAPLQFPKMDVGNSDQQPSISEQAKQTLGYSNPDFIEVADSYEYPNSSLVTKARTSGSEIQRATRLYKSEKFQRAVDILQPYLQQNPRDHNGHSLLSACLFRLKDIDVAQEHALQAIDLHASVNTYSNYGSILSGIGKRQAAIEAYLKAHEHDHKHYLPIRNLVTLYYNEKNLEKAEEFLHELIRVDPHDSYSYVSLGQVLVEQNKWQEAEHVYRYRIVSLQRASQQERELAGGMMLDLPLALGRVLIHLRKFEEAEKWLLQTIALSSTTTTSWAPARTYAKFAKLELRRLYKVTNQPEKAAQLND